jgi:hypothetical protein
VIQEIVQAGEEFVEVAPTRRLSDGATRQARRFRARPARKARCAVGR